MVFVHILAVDAPPLELASTRFSRVEYELGKQTPREELGREPQWFFPESVQTNFRLPFLANTWSRLPPRP